MIDPKVCEQGSIITVGTLVSEEIVIIDSIRFLLCACVCVCMCMWYNTDVLMVSTLVSTNSWLAHTPG